MRLAALPPVRRAVPLRRGSPAARLSMERFFGDRKITLYASGTAALAQAISQCVTENPVNSPEVIIPAYGCPDLIAACLHAAARPRIVDVAPQHWSYDLRALESTLSFKTVAIVAVNLLGLGDGSSDLIQLCKERKIPLIQDSAQFLPREPVNWPGDYVVLSFGRGKPLNLLHGGALIHPYGARQTPSAFPIRQTSKDILISSRLAAISFNVLTRPGMYSILSALPGTGLGQVNYRPLHAARVLSEHAWKQVGIAFELYRLRPSYDSAIWASAIKDWSKIGIQTLRCPSAPIPSEPIRLAMLAPNRAARDTLVATFKHFGLGATSLYGADLTQLANIPKIAKSQGPFPYATALADKLFTLPTHDMVTAETIKCARNATDKWHYLNVRLHK